MKQKVRIGYLIALALIIVCGLLSRKIDWLPEETGDALWAIMVFCLLRVIFPTARLLYIALGSLAVAYCVEFSQLIRWPWLVEFRNTTVGHLMLGQGFLWSDIVAYTIGIVLFYLLTGNIEQRYKN